MEDAKTIMKPPNAIDEWIKSPGVVSVFLLKARTWTKAVEAVCDIFQWKDPQMSLLIIFAWILTWKYTQLVVLLFPVLVYVFVLPKLPPSHRTLKVNGIFSETSTNQTCESHVL